MYTYIYIYIYIHTHMADSLPEILSAKVSADSHFWLVWGDGGKLRPAEGRASHAGGSMGGGKRARPGRKLRPAGFVLGPTIMLVGVSSIISISTLTISIVSYCLFMIWCCLGPQKDPAGDGPDRRAAPPLAKGAGVLPHG